MSLTQLTLDGIEIHFGAPGGPAYEVRHPETPIPIPPANQSGAQLHADLQELAEDVTALRERVNNLSVNGVVLSEDADNTLQQRPDGLYAPPALTQDGGLDLVVLFDNKLI